MFSSLDQEAAFYRSSPTARNQPKSPERPVAADSDCDEDDDSSGDDDLCYRVAIYVYIYMHAYTLASLLIVVRSHIGIVPGCFMPAVDLARNPRDCQSDQ